MKDNFQQIYLKEIGVQTPISLFVPSSTETSLENKVVDEVVQSELYAKPAQEAVITVAEVAAVAQKPKIAPNVSKVDDLSALQTQVEACVSCDLAKSRNKVVFGSGHQQADLVFIGDAPSREDDVAGQPIIGSAGQLFTRMLASVGLDRDSVYVMNGVKCRPQHGRTPKPEEFAVCEQWLVHQLDMLQPKLICMLGRVVAHTLLKNEASLADLREGQFDFRGIPVLVIDHPSYLLRSQQHKRRAWADLNRLKAYYQTLI
ncbi:uracil-DNA glycosylase [Ghiorsea bivora]|uniref:uracil-DNA glycosylase n=1 Tax=Ghiorsea bivora TaxID=1485545 RepID=UPI00068F8C9D|nr:uracil-DNA glycosylase [Ghiorsea bivora]